MRRVLSLSVVCSLFIIALLAAGLTTPAFASSARITQAVDESKVVRLAGNTRPEAMNPANDRGPVSDNLDVDHMFLVLQRSPAQEQKLNKFIDSLNDRKSPNFHQWLTPEQYGEYGVAQEDINKITGWLEYHGFRINQVYANRMLIDFGGTAGQLREAFRTSIHQLEVNGEQHIANVFDPVIPAALSPVVKGIASLHDFKPEPMYKVRPDYTFAGCASSSTFPTAPGTCYAVTPQDDAVIYGLNGLWAAGITGQGQTIAVVEDTDTYNGAADWNSFRTAFGLTGYPGTYSQVHPGSCTDPSTNGDDGEAALDVEMATAFAPGAAVELISCSGGTFTFGGLVALTNLVNAAGPYPGIVSVSYGGCEASTGNGGNQSFYNTYQQAAAEGISVFVSSGDAGPVGCSPDFTNGTSYDLASLAVTGWGETPYNVSVGGTDFEDTYNSKTGQNGGAPLSTYWNATNGSGYGSAKSYIPEIPWNDSCASALISEVATGNFTTYGTGHICNTSPFNTASSYLSTGAAAGGASNCAIGQGGSLQGSNLISAPECQGWPKPSWQSGSSLSGGLAVYGVPSDGVRDIPDVSLFASNGEWGHFQTVCWSDPTQTSGGAVSCSGAPSTWSGFGGTSVATPSMAGIQALVNQSTSSTWGNPNPIYYQIAQNQYGTSGGSFLGSACNSSASGGPGSLCVFNDVTQGDIDVTCEYNSTTEEAHCYKPSATYGVTSTDVVTTATVIWGGSGYTTAPTCTIAGPSNNNPYKSPTGTTLYAGGTQATCTAAVTATSTTAVWTVTPSSTYYTYDAGLIITVGSQNYTMSGTTRATLVSNLCTAINANNTVATCTASSTVATITAKVAGAAGNFQVNYAPILGGPALNEPLVLTLANTVKGQGPNYVSGITITAAGRGYQPETPITFGGPGTGALAVANTSPGTASSSYQPTYGAAPGYDLATGLGSVNAYNLVCNNAWGSSPSFCIFPQTITVTTAPPSSAAYNSTFGVAATASSGLTVAFTASGSCSVVDNGDGTATYTMTSGTGTCSVIMNQAGGTNSGTNYSAAPTVTDTVNATLATATVTLSNLTQTYTGSALSPTVTTTPSGLTYTLTGAPDTNAGSYPVTATVNAGQNYTGSASGTFVIGQAANTVTFTTPPPASAEYGSQFTVAAAGLGTGAITYTSDGVVCTNVLATYTVIGSGTCVVTASQAADTNYVAASTSANVTATNANSSMSLALTTGTDPSTYGQSVTFTATLTSDTGLAKRKNAHKKPLNFSGNVTWSANTGCADSAVSGYPATATCTTTALAAGSDSVVATFAGDANHTGTSATLGQTVNPAANTVTFTTPAPASAEYGSTFTVAAAGLGTGAISYTSDGVVCSNSGATYTMLQGSGTCTVTASQAADNNYLTASASESVTAANAQTTVGVATSGSPSSYGQSVTFTATLTSDTGLARRKNTHKKPMNFSGNVTWSANTGCAASAVSSYPATATCTTTALPVGSDTVTATYAGDANHGGGSGSVAQTVTGGVATAISVTSVSPASEDYGSAVPVTVSATLSWTGSGAAPTASDVTFSGNGSGTFGAANCGAASGDAMTCTATYTPANDAAGSYTFVAAFSGDSNYASSSSAQTNNFAINAATTTTAVTSAPNPSTYAQQVVFTATIGAENNFVKGRRNTHKKPMDVTGSVAWSTNTGCGSTAVTWDPVNLVGTATCTTSRASSLQVGNDTVTATYPGDANHSGSAGSVVQVVQGGIATTIDVTSVSPAAEDYAANTAVTITALLSWTGNGVAPTAADVTIGGNGGGTYGATTCAARVHETITCTATYTPSSDAAGTYTETAAFSGDTNYSASSSSQTNNFTINPATTTTTVTSIPNPSTYAQQVVFTATIGAENNFVKGRRNARKPMDVTGSVAWSTNTGCGTTAVTWDPVNLVGIATCTTSRASSLQVGNDTVTATYSGDSNHGGSAGSVVQVVQGGIATTIDVTSVSPASEAFAANSPVTITALLSWTGNGKAPTAANVTIGGNGNGTYGATSCAARVHETMTCTATYTPNNSDVVGAYTETATFSGDANYTGSSSSETNNFAISKATATLAFSNLSQTYTGSALTPTVTTTPSGLSYSLTGAPDTNAGSYPVTATITDSNYTGTASDTFVINKAAATVALSNLTQTYTGAALAPTVTTTPSGLSYSLTGAPDTNAGSYPVTATVTDPNYTGSASGTFVIGKASQTITLTGVPASAVYGTTFTVTGNASSGLAVSYSSAGSCSNAGAAYTMTSGTGSCLVTASQAGNGNYAAATPVNQSVTATKASQTITVTTPAPATAPKSYAFTIGASASSGLAITYGASGVCTVSGATYTMSASSGTCTETLSQAGDNNYAAATSVVEHTTGKPPVKPTVSLTGAPAAAVYGDTYTVTASSTDDTAVPVITASTSTCTVGANQVSGTTVSALVTITNGGGTCQVAATWAQTNIYSATTVKATTTLTKATPTVSLTGAPASAAKGSSFTVTATSDESGILSRIPTITVAPTSACIVGAVNSSGGGSYQATVTMKSATATCTTTAKWAATAGYNAASASETTTATP